MTSMHQPENRSFWFSINHQSSHTSYGTQSKHTLLITSHPGSQADRLLEKIRLVIVTDLEGIVLGSCRESSASIRAGKRCIQVQPELGNTYKEPAAQLVLHLVWCESEVSVLLQRPLQDPSSTGLGLHRNLRVIHDEIYPIPSHISLSCLPLEGYYFSMDTLQYHVNVRSITRKEGTQPPALPPQVLQNIARNLENFSVGKGIPWSAVKALLPYARVSSCWSSILDVLWAHPLGDRYDPVPIDNVCLLADFLDKKPSIAIKVKSTPRFNLANYGDFAQSPTWRNLTSSLYKLISCCPNLRRIVIADEQLPSLREPLCSLRDVEYLLVESLNKPRPSGWGVLLNIVEVSQPWERLQKVDLIIWEEEERSMASGNAVLSLTHRDLHHDRQIIDRQLSLPSLSSPKSTFLPGIIKLVGVRGIDNNDLYRCLSVLSRALEELEITGCTMNPLLDTEELALDRIIPDMSALHVARVASPFTTTTTIARKRCSEDGVHSRVSIYFHSTGEIPLFFDEREWLRVSKNDLQLPRALARTGWSEVNLEVRYATNSVKPDLREALMIISEKAREVALERGIAFKGFS